MKNAIVIGGGLAGLVAARALATSGRCRPLVLEASSILGGLAASWRDEGGSLVETGLHVCFPHYRHLLALLHELGTGESIAWSDRALRYVRQDGDVAELRFPRLPPPLHGAVAVARHRHLGARDRVSALVGAVEATLSSRVWRSRYDGISFSDWARRRGLTRRLVSTVFEPMVGGLTFLRSSEVSARAMLDYIHAVGHRADDYRVGLFKAACADVLAGPLAAEVTRHGGELRRNCGVSSLLLRSGRVVGVRTADGAMLHADAVVSAVPCHALFGLAPEALRRNPSLRNACGLRPVPVASVLVWFDRRIGGPRGLRFSSGCIFNTWTDMADQLPELHNGHSVLQLVIAPMDDLDAIDDCELGARVVADVRRVLPGARCARVEKLTVTRTPRSVHAVVPGSEAMRPDVDIGVPGLFLAGCYLRTDHNPNMESAVISGRRAAEAVLEALA